MMRVAEVKPSDAQPEWALIWAAKVEAAAVVVVVAAAELAVEVELVAAAVPVVEVAVVAAPARACQALELESH